MKCLWLTFHDPSPAINGQYLYSEGLIRAVAQAGVEIDVVAIARPDGGRHGDGEREGSVTWHISPSERAKWSLPISRHPRVAARSATPELRKRIRGLLKQARYDAVVFDSICAGWALDLKELAARDRPQLVHIAHNRETTVARRIAVEERRRLHRLVKRFDAWKVDRLERRLFERSDLSTSNTPEDRSAFQAEHPLKRVELLPPGYGGPKRASRVIGAKIPRRAILVGSFDWGPKRASLGNFLRIAAPLFRDNKIELQIVGGAEQEFLANIRERFPSVVFAGRVDDIYTPLANARIALVPDYLGGFKLKSLDYVFNRVPIFSLRESVPGLPLVDGQSVRLFPDHSALAMGVVESIDHVDRLNKQQEAAFAACAGAFDWARIGAKLIGAMSSATPARSASKSLRREATAHA